MTYTLHERDGLFELDSYERWEPPQVFARATHIDDMLRHIITIAGDAYRERRNYLYIRLPYRTPKPGYTPISITPKWTTIQRYDGTLLPFELCGTPPSIEANEYTYLADLPLDDIAASYKHPHAYPLYHDYLATTRYLPPG